MLIAHKIALDLNNAQKTYMARASGTARFAYNWALAEWQRQYEAWKINHALPKPSQTTLRRQLNSIKREQFPWMLAVTKNAPQMAIIQLGNAFRNFFAGRAKYPKFRKKGVHDCFTLTNDQFRLDGSRLRVPNLGWVRLREQVRFTGKILSATVSRVADRWFISVAVDTPRSTPTAPWFSALGRCESSWVSTATLMNRIPVPKGENSFGFDNLNCFVVFSLQRPSLGDGFGSPKNAKEKAQQLFPVGPFRFNY